jgi:hypothetical protein
MLSLSMADQPLNGLRSVELKRRGIAAVEETLRSGSVKMLQRCKYEPR